MEIVGRKRAVTVVSALSLSAPRLRRTAGSALLGLLVLAASGCSESSVAPSPLPPSSSATLTAVMVEGRVLDEQNQPVEGARITLRSIENTSVSDPPSVTADGTGNFSFNLELPPIWRWIILRADRSGYESDNHVFVRPEHGAVLINMYRSLTIRPGESIETSVSLQSFSYLCGFAASLCRRVIVTPPSGELVDIEVFPADGQKDVGLARDQLGWGVELPSRLTVAGGDEVWIVVDERGRVTLRAVGR